LGVKNEALGVESDVGLPTVSGGHLKARTVEYSYTKKSWKGQDLNKKQLIIEKEKTKQRMGVSERYRCGRRGFPVRTGSKGMKHSGKGTRSANLKKEKRSKSP